MKKYILMSFLIIINMLAVGKEDSPDGDENVELSWDNAGKRDLKDLFKVLEREKVIWLQRIFKLNLYDYKLIVRGVENLEKLSIYDLNEEAIVYEFSPKIEVERFKSVDLVRLTDYIYPFFFIRWSKGVHGERLIVLENNDQVFKSKEYLSQWPIEQKLVGNKVHLRLYDEAEGDPKGPKGKEEIWSPTPLPEAPSK